MTALAALAERVGALKGALLGSFYSDEHRPLRLMLERAFEFSWAARKAIEDALIDGSLDAAVAFKEAMMPGAGVTLVWGYDDAPDAQACAYVTTEGEIISHPVLAHALVLAVLRALEAQHGEG